MKFGYFFETIYEFMNLWIWDYTYFTSSLVSSFSTQSFVDPSACNTGTALVKIYVSLGKKYEVKIESLLDGPL